jgi:hypothetical protein
MGLKCWRRGELLRRVMANAGWNYADVSMMQRLPCSFFSLLVSVYPIQWISVH